MTTSLAAVFEGTPGEIRLRHIATPRAGQGEILVKVLGCTLCGSDLHSFEGRRTVPVPTILGHEIVGETLEFGDEAPRVDLGGKPLKQGDRITWAIVANCGECALCRCDLPQKCLNGVKYGHEAFEVERVLLGGFAEHCILVPGTAIVRLPDDMPLAVACPASCATATVVAAIEAAGDLSGRTVCIMGAGMLGLTACALARTHGASQVLCVDPIEERRQQAHSFGATRTCDPSGFADVATELVGAFGFDACIELSGHSSAVQSGLSRLRLGGTLVLVGSVFPGGAFTIDPERIVRRNLTIKGIHNYAPKHLTEAVEFLSTARHAFPFESLVSAWYPLAAIAKAFTQGSRPGIVRVGVCPTDQAP